MKKATRKNIFKFIIFSLFLISGLGFYNSSSAFMYYFDGWKIDCLIQAQVIDFGCIVTPDEGGGGGGGGGFAGMSGTLVPSLYSCEIEKDQGSCPVTLSWNVLNPDIYLGTALSSDIDNNGNSSSNYIISPAPSTGTVDSGTKVDVAAPFGGRSFYLYNNAQLLATTSVSTTCAQGLGWDDASKRCIASPLSPVLSSFYTNPGCIDATNGNDDGGGSCGDSICQSGENGLNCSADCAPVCGNGICETVPHGNTPGETMYSCWNDCPYGGGGGGGGGDGKYEECQIQCSDSLNQNGSEGPLLESGAGGKNSYTSCMSRCMGIYYVQGAQSVAVTYNWTGAADSCSSPVTGLFPDDRQGISNGSDEYTVYIDPETFAPLTHAIQCDRNSQVVSRSHTLNLCSNFIAKPKYGERK